MVSIRYKQLGMVDGIKYNREALAFRPLGHPGHSSSLINLANVIHGRYFKLGRIEDLDEQSNAITKYLLSLSLVAEFIILLLSVTSLLPFVLAMDRFGRADDLEEAIQYYRKALAFFPLGHPNHSIIILLLGFFLAHTFP